MSTLRECAYITQSLEPEDYAVLSTLAKLLVRYRNVPREAIIQTSGLHPKKVDFSLSKLQEYKLVSRTQYGYRLLYAGLDVLALHTLRSRGVVMGLGLPIALGKESDVYEGVDRNGEKLAVKAFRIGRISFRDIKRKRGYIREDVHEWLIASINAAKKEYGVLRRLAKYDLQVPKPKANSYHLIAMNRIDGVLLRYVKHIKDPLGLLMEILACVKRCYLAAKVVHGALSDFNVLVSIEDDNWKRAYIIDWPQAVWRNDPRADDLLNRDIENIVRFFSKRFRVTVSKADAVSYVKGTRESL